MLPQREEYSIYNVSIKILSGDNFALCLGNFLEKYYSATNEERIAMTARSPVDLPAYEQIPFLAAAAHKLANDFGLAPPAWVFEARCYAPRDKPYFGNNATNKLKCFYMYVSPPEFKHRNLFVDANVLMRV